MNIYVTTESEVKLKTLFTNIKSFFIFDVQAFINDINLDLTKQSNIYFINMEIMNSICAASKLKKYQGIVYINKNLNKTIINNLKCKFKNIKEISKVVLIDNGTTPKLSNLYDACEEIYFYERFYKNKIIECQGITKTTSGNTVLIMEDTN